MAYLRRRTRRRSYRRSGSSFSLTGVRTFRPRGGAVLQPRVTRMVRRVASNFYDVLCGTQGTNLTPNSRLPMTACVNDFAFDAAYQGTPNVCTLNLIPRGSGAGMRSGNRILMRDLVIRGSMYYSPLCTAGGVQTPIGASAVNGGGTITTPISNNEIDRSVTIFILYYPRLAMAATVPPWTSLLQPPLNSYSPLSMENVFNARVLMRKTVRLRLTPTAYSSSSNPVYGLSSTSRYDFQWKIRLNVPAEFDIGGTGASLVDELHRGHIVLRYFSAAGPITYPAGQPSVPNLNFDARISFVDA